MHPSTPSRAATVALMIALVAAPLVAVAPSGQAQAHDHGAAEGGLHLHAGAEDGGTVRVGEVLPIVYYILDDDGALVGHVDTDVAVTQNGDLLAQFKTPHEHDGVFHLEVRFPRPGPFTVTVTRDDGEASAMLEGWVVQPDATADVELSVQGPSETSMGTPATYTVSAEYVDGVGGDHDHGYDGGDGEATAARSDPAVDGAGDSPGEGDDGDGPHAVQHAEVRVRVYRQLDDKLVQRIPLHIHSDSATFQVDPRVPGDYDVRVELYPGDEDHAAFDPVVEARTLTVRPGIAGAPEVKAPPLPGMMEAVPAADHLRVSVDPYTMVGPLTDLRLNALYLDGDGAPVPHVDFTFTLTDPLGDVVLASEDVHRHGGILEVLAHTPLLGTYEVKVTAEPTKDAPFPAEEAVAWYTVQPPTAAAESVPGTVQLHGVDALATGASEELTLEFTDLTGMPVEHVEADLEMYRAGDPVPLWTTKLHSHSKDVVLDARFLEPGGHYLKVNPSPQSPSAQVYFTPAGPLEDLGFAFDVAGDRVPEPTVAAGEDADGLPVGATLPGPGALVALAAAVAAAVGWAAVRRRT